MSKTNTNPLSSYFRQKKNYISLPSSRSTIYDGESVVEYVGDRNEVSIRAMTSIDDMVIRNPDALLNGEAIVQIINSCVEEVKNPKKLCINDVNTLMVAIKLASNGPEHQIKINCPKCNHENSYAISLEDLISTVKMLDHEYVVSIGDLKVYVKPHTLEGHLKAMGLGFEENRTFKLLQSDDADDQARIEAFSKAIKKMSQLNFDLVNDCIIKIVMPDGSEVVDKDHIREFITNIELVQSKEISEKIDQINQIGLNKELEAVCTECSHAWKHPVSFNPTDFFTLS